MVPVPAVHHHEIFERFSKDFENCVPSITNLFGSHY